MFVIPHRAWRYHYPYTVNKFATTVLWFLQSLSIVLGLALKGAFVYLSYVIYEVRFGDGVNQSNVLYLILPVMFSLIFLYYVWMNLSDATRYFIVITKGRNPLLSQLEYITPVRKDTRSAAEVNFSDLMETWLVLMIVGMVLLPNYPSKSELVVHTFTLSYLQTLSLLATTLALDIALATVPCRLFVRFVHKMLEKDGYWEELRKEREEEEEFRRTHPVPNTHRNLSPFHEPYQPRWKRDRPRSPFNQQ